MSALASITTQIAGVKVGDIVENFSAICRVEEIDAERGLLVKIVAGGGKGQRYFANPSLCKLQGEVLQHKSAIC